MKIIPKIKSKIAPARNHPQPLKNLRFSMQKASSQMPLIISIAEKNMLSSSYVMDGFRATYTPAPIKAAPESINIHQ
ncbi:hypothetical protein L0660_11655 [Dyadobacter sp. CY351]|nr:MULTISPECIES: hypothetical protein [unclassified Dyadobacter]MCE7070574.1 hypothetical protein [Dyadobacter sp. CY327]MCF2518312.1 hypothetical protein [Dyadobacter sp. CY351]